VYVTSQHQVVHNGCMLKEFYVLKGACYALFCHFVRQITYQVFTFQEDPSRIRLIYAAYQIKYGGLA